MRNAESISIFSDGQTSVENPISTQSKVAPFSLEQRLDAYFTLNEKNIFAANFRHAHKEKDPFYEAMTKLRPFPEMLPLEETSLFDIGQNAFVKTNQFDGRVDYYHLFDEKNHLNFSFGTTFREQNYRSSIFQITNSGKKTLEEETFQNSVQHSFRDSYIGLHYTLLTGVFILSPGGHLHYFETKTKQLRTKTETKQTLFLPNFTANIDFLQGGNLRFSYAMEADFNNIETFAEGYVLRAYNHLFRGNQYLENGLSHDFNLRFRRFNMFNFTTMNAYIRYSRKVDEVLNNTFLEQANRVSVPKNSPFPSEIFAAGGAYQKTLRKFTLNLNADFSFENHEIYINSEKQTATNFSQDYQFGLNTNFDRGPNFEIGYSQRIDQYRHGDLKQVFYTGELSFRAETEFLQNFNFSADFAHFNYFNKEKTLKNKYSFLDATLTFRPRESAWEFGIKANNLLDVGHLNRNHANENYTMTSAFYVQPRTLVFSVRYDL